MPAHLISYLHDKLILMAKNFKTNIGLFDRGMRLTYSLATLFIAYKSHLHSHSMIYILRGSAALMLISAVTGFSLLYHVLRYSTLETKKAPAPTTKDDFTWDGYVSETPNVKTRNYDDLRLELEDKKKPSVPKVHRTLAPRRYELEEDIPPDKILELIDLLEKNQLDEMLLLRIYEKIYSCEVTIIHAHIDTYQCDFGKTTELLDYATLLADLIKALKKQ